MALTRKMLKAMSIEDDKIDEIIAAHTETVDSLKEERDKHKKDAESYAQVKEENAKLKKDLESAGGDDWKEKYESEHEAYEDYKKQVETDKEISEKKNLYRKLLTDSKIDEKRIDTILKVTDVSKLNVKDGKFENEAEIVEEIKKEWEGFIVSTSPGGADVPPSDLGGGGAVTTKEEFLKMSLNDQMKWANEHESEYMRLMAE